MRRFVPHVHGYLDYLTVLVFAAAPAVLGLTGIPAMLAYVLAGVHLVLTGCTAFPLGVLKVVPLPLHAIAEVTVSLALVLAPFVLGFANDAVGRTFFLVMGLGIFGIWLVTDYRSDVHMHPSEH